MRTFTFHKDMDSTTTTTTSNKNKNQNKNDNDNDDNHSHNNNFNFDRLISPPALLGLFRDAWLPWTRCSASSSVSTSPAAVHHSLQ